ncbi:MAG: hypothetical protein DBX55_00610 [Verrucomicrobia bacterium]|nr:MAG: hypothetical protein DBX55_00610 [Verrucomicrobiota bacterium]
MDWGGAPVRRGAHESVCWSLAAAGKAARFCGLICAETTGKCGNSRARRLCCGKTFRRRQEVVAVAFAEKAGGVDGLSKYAESLLRRAVFLLFPNRG